MKKKIVLLCAVGLLCLFACKKKKDLVYNPEDCSVFFERFAPFFTISHDSIHAAIVGINAQVTDSALWVKALKIHYDSVGQFLWIREGGMRQVDSLLYWIGNVESHGLNPEIFGYSRLQQLTQQLKTGEKLNAKELNQNLAQLEYYATKAYLTYSTGISYGFIDPHQFYDETDQKPEGKITDYADYKPKSKLLYHIPLRYCDSIYVDSIMDMLKRDCANRNLREIQPTDPFYTEMQREIRHYLPLEKVIFDSIPLFEAMLNIGDQHEAIPLIAARLQLTGEYTPSVSDTVQGVLTSELLEAVNRFRRKNRLPEDQAIGAFTIRYLNRPLNYYTDRLRVNLERARWKTEQEKGEKYVLVNTAAFMLKAIDQTLDTIMEMPICCGSVRHKTPLLSSKIGYMELNPYWNVPQSIIKNEIVPAYLRDNTYFTRNRMKVYDASGKQVNPHAIKWSKYKKYVPFTVKQDNGAGNSLGRIIFRFPNSFAVYLHDTPSRAPFKRTNRAVSHGCVRLERPLDFAFFLLDKPDPIIQDRIRVAMGLKAVSEEGKAFTGKAGYKDMEKYAPAKKTPLLIDYQTMYFSAAGELSFCEDAYRYDAVLLETIELLNSDYGENQ